MQTIDALVVEIEQAGPDITPSQAARLGRAKELLRQIEAETTRLAQAAGQVIPAAQSQAIQQALQRAESLTVAQAPDAQAAAELARQWTGLNRGALENLVGALSDGSPLDDWLRQLAPDAVQAARDVLTDGVARGINPRDLARELTRATGMPLNRAMSVSRTETMRSFTQASLTAMQENGDIVTMYERSAAMSPRTCAACIALSGKRYPLTVPFDEHPQGRCSPIPVLDDPDGLLPEIETGEQWFARQPADVQRQILGIGGYDAYRRGEIQLQDMVAHDSSEKWGGSNRRATLSEARAAAKRRRSGERTAAD